MRSSRLTSRESLRESLSLAARGRCPWRPAWFKTSLLASSKVVLVCQPTVLLSGPAFRCFALNSAACAACPAHAPCLRSDLLQGLPCYGASLAQAHSPGWSPPALLVTGALYTLRATVSYLHLRCDQYGIVEPLFRSCSCKRLSTRQGSACIELSK